MISFTILLRLERLPEQEPYAVIRGSGGGQDRAGRGVDPLAGPEPQVSAGRLRQRRFAERAECQGGTVCHRQPAAASVKRGRTRKLYNVGDEATITFYADKKEDPTGVYLKEGMQYEVSIHEEDLEDWRDCTYETDVGIERSIFLGKPFYNKIVGVLGFPIEHTHNTGYMGLIGKVRGKIYPIGKLGIEKETFVPQNNGNSYC